MSVSFFLLMVIGESGFLGVLVLDELPWVSGTGNSIARLHLVRPRAQECHRTGGDLPIRPWLQLWLGLDQVAATWNGRNISDVME